MNRSWRSPFHFYLRNGWEATSCWAPTGPCQARLLMGEGSCSTFCAPSLGSHHNSCVSLPAYFFPGWASQEDTTAWGTGLGSGQATCCLPLRVRGPSMPGLICPPSRCSCLSEPGFPIPCRLENRETQPRRLFPPESRADMAAPSSPSLSSGKAGAGWALLRVSVLSIKGKKGKKNSQCCEKGWPRLFYPPSGLNPCCRALPPAMEKAFVLSRARLGDIVEQQRPAAATAARHSSPVCRRFVARWPFV